ncbi:MAG TPA: hypothetical protein VF165_05440 [Nocardioidaceae bacterium]
MTAATRDNTRPLGEAELLTRLIAAAHESVEKRLSEAEVDSILDVETPAQAT